MENLEEELEDSDERPDWDTYFLLIAKAVSARASCPRASVGAVVVNEDNRILSTGYNGAPADEVHCIDEGCELSSDGHCMCAVHAEDNAISYAKYKGVDMTGCTLYYYDSMNRVAFSIEELKEHCTRCGLLAEEAGIARVMGVGDDYLEQPSEDE